MIFTPEKLKTARDSGYTDDEIWNFLGKDDQRFNLAKENGYTLDDTINTFSKVSPLEEQPSGTSFGEEVSQLGSAFVESIGRPLENMGESFESFGFTGVADALKGAITEPENYVSAGQRFMEPAPNEAQFMGFAWQYAPRAAVEQVGQAIGAIGTRAVGAAAGGAVAGPPGAIAGGFLGPAVFGAAQVIGPVAKERAMNNGREVPNNSDLVAATLTAIGSGSLDAIGAKYLPGGEKATGKFFKRVASAFVGEGLLTEAPQSVIEQIGATAGTEKGLNINVKQAVGEGLIGGTSAAGLTAIVSPLSKPAENQVIRTPEQAEELDIDSKSNQEAILLMGDPADQTQNERVTKLKEIESVIANNETLMTGLEPNAPERSKLDLENRVAKKEAEKLKAEITQGAGLSETITEAEKQQIELAKAITEPAPEVVAPAAPTAKEGLAVPPAPTTQTLPSIPQAMGALRTGTIEGLYTMLFDKLNAGDTTELGKPSKVLIEAMPAYQAGVIKSPTDLQNWVNGDAKMREDLQKIQAAQVAPKPLPTETLPFAPEAPAITPAPVDETPAAAPAPKVAPAEIEAVHFSRTPMKLEKGVDISKIKGAYEEESTFGRGFYAAEKADESMWREMDRFKLGDFRNEVKISPQNPLIISPETVKKLGYDSIKDRIDKGNYDAIITRGWSEDTGNKISQRIEQLWTPKFPSGKTSGRFTNVEEFRSANEQAIKEITGLSEYDYTNLDKQGWNQNQIFIPPDTAPDIVSTTPAVSETITPAEPEGISVGNRIKLGKSPQTYIVEEAIPQTEAEKANNEQFYSVKNERTGETQVVEKADMKQVGGKRVRKMAVEVIPKQESVTPIPEANRYTFEEAVKAVDAHFGKKGIPEGVVIVNNTTEPDLEMKAGYFVNRGQIVINLAYIAKGENLGDIIDHELGHYIFGDPKFQADFKKFWELMTPEEKAKADQIINQFYNKETGAVQIEEKQVRAFMQLIQDSKAMPKWKQLLDKIKRWINEKLGTNLQVTDRGALAVLAAAHKRFKSGEQIVREIDSGVLKMAAEREQIMGEKIGPLKKTPEGIIAETQAKLRERFDPTKVTEQNTTEAFRALGRLTGKDGTAFAQELNDIGRMVDESGAAAEVSMGAALFVNDLFEYAVRLAAQGQKMMLGIMMTNINKLPTGTEGRSDAGRALRAAREMKDTFLTMAKAEQDAFINYAAEFVYGPNPTKQQVDSIKIGYDAVEKVQEPTAKEVEEEIAAVGEKTGTDLVGRINDEFTKATEKGQAKRKTEIEELDSEYKKIQEQADKEIEKLAKIQSDTPAFARQVVNEIRAIIANDLKQRPDMESKAQWKSALVDKLQNAGVEPSRAERLADLVWRQHEINNLSREIDSINRAVEKGPISEIIKAIKETPLEQQQNPNWRYEVMRDYLRKAGLSVAQAERIAKLMDISLQKRFTQAKEQAFTDAISKTAPWKAGDVRSKRAFQQVIQAIRAGALDPSRNMASDIAAMNGWTGFTADQYKNLLKNDAILANEDSKDIQKAEAYKAIQDIISKSKLPIRARDVIGQYYDAQALSGIPTLTVNSFSPIAFAMRNAIVQAGFGAIKGDAKAIGRAATAFVDSIKSWANTVAFSFKNNVTVYSNVDYIVNDDNLLRLYRKGVDQFTKSKNAKERADGVKNMMIGMMDYVRRILNALDYGAIASLQNQNISKYAMAVMKRQKMNDKQANEMFGVMMKAKNDFYLQQIAIGTDKNKAGILADEFYISSWKEALSKAGVEKSDIQQAMDAAINDALSSVGRNRQSLDAFKEEDTKLKDAGVSSMPALWLLESVANAANRSDNQVVKLFSRVIYGFAIVPARVIRETAWFSPYGFVRFGYDWTAKKMGKTSPYAQSLGTDVQYSQRLAEATAGTVALLGLMALRSGSTDDPEDEDEFKIVFTGNGPQRKDDAQFYDSWYKAGNKPNSMIVSFGKTKFTLNMMRGFEAFTWPAMMLGAIDDLEIRKKQKQQTKTPAQLEDAAIVAGFVFDAALRRGPYAFTTKSLFGTYGDIGVEGVAKGLTFPAKTLIPVLGTSLASNLSNFLNDPIDRRTLDGAVWSNIPFIGPAVAPKSLNAFGEPSLSTDLASKMFKLGVPIVYDIPTDRESIKLHELVLKQGGGPSIPTRNQLAQRLDRQPTNKEYEMFVREYGTILTTSMKKNYDKLFNAKPEFYSRAIERIGLRARDVAENKVRQAAKKP